MNTSPKRKRFLFGSLVSILADILTQAAALLTWPCPLLCSATQFDIVNLSLQPPTLCFNRIDMRKRKHVRIKKHPDTAKKGICLQQQRLSLPVVFSFYTARVK
jgi:hypothetical protein